MAGRRDSESFWPAAPATPPRPVTVDDFFDEDEDDVSSDGLDGADVLDEDITPSGIVVKKRKQVSAVMKRPSAIPVTQQASAVTVTPLDATKLPLKLTGIVTRPLGVMKRPASASVTGPSTSPSASVTGPSTRTVPIGDTLKGMLIKMRYSKTKAIGIRLRGGRQLMQVQCNGARPELIDHWANLCITKLEEGLAVDDVKDWLSNQKSNVMGEDSCGNED